MASLSGRCNFIKRRLAAQSYLARDTRRDLPSIRSSTFALTLFVAFEESSRRCERRLSIGHQPPTGAFAAGRLDAVLGS
jgi:hypothetical protein